MLKVSLYVQKIQKFVIFFTPAGPNASGVETDFKMIFNKLKGRLNKIGNANFVPKLILFLLHWPLPKRKLISSTCKGCIF